MATNPTIDQKDHPNLRQSGGDAIHNRTCLANIVIGYTNHVEEIAINLEKKDEELQQRPNELALQDVSFNQLLDEYSQHEKYMTELCEYCHVIIRSKEEGQELRDDETLTQEDRDEVGIQMDAMLVYYDRLKILATDRLQMLQRMIDERQRSKIERLEKWLSVMESELKSLNNIGTDYDTIQKQLQDIKELQLELERKQESLNFISKVIIFDDFDLESMQLRCRSSGTLERQLEEMNERWTNICQLVESRHKKLEQACLIWRVLEVEGPVLYDWLKRIQTDLNDLSDAIQNVTDQSFVVKLMSRSEFVDHRIKSKQSFYTSLENRVRLEIDHFDDPCSPMVIELEKKLEDMQDNWNAIMRQKRMIDFSLNALLEPNSPRQRALPLIRPMIPIPDPINSSPVTTMNCTKQDSDPGSVGNDDKGSSLQSNGSTMEPSKAFDTSYSSQDTRSISANHNLKHKLSYDETSHDDISSATNLTSPPTTNSAAELLYIEQLDDSTNTYPPMINLDFEQLENANNHNHSHGEHNCRVEEWRHSWESFSNWLKQVENSLEIECVPLEIQANEYTRNYQNQEPTWSHMNAQEQIALIRNIDKHIETVSQGEFDCLFLQGKQIIEDLLPEIGEKKYEANLKDILADLDIRYGIVKQRLAERKHELADRERWRLSGKIRDSCNYIIAQMSEVTPENEIGVDLITIAQQQDQLMRQKEDAEQNPLIHSIIKETKSFLSFCDSLQQQYQPPNQDDFVKIWMSFKEFKEDIEDQLGRLQIHHSELSQLIQDRLTRLDDIHKEMHALQHSIQDLATELQVTEILRSSWVPLDELSIEQLSEQLEDLKLYRERLSEADAIQKLMNSIVDWMEESGTPLSQSNLKRIDELNDVWDFIQASVQDRQKAIEQAFDEQSGSEQKFLAETVSDLPGKWERRVATSKVPYFVDGVSNKTVWDHPKFTNLLNGLEECKKYVYPVYRTATKLRIVQKKLGIERLLLEHLKNFLTTFDSHRAQQNSQNQESTATVTVDHDSQINIEQIIFLLKAIYTKIQKEELPDLKIPLAIDLTLNWLLNLYGLTRTGSISALSMKVGLGLMCRATRKEKYMFMFELISDPLTNKVDARKLGTLFEICMRTPIYLGEEEAFGGTEIIETSIRDCFAMSKFNPQHPNCIGLNDYLNWLKTEPQFISWLPVLHRILISENTVHETKCRLCKIYPIVGLRYRCLKCFKFHICQKCFWSGRHIQEHPDPDVHIMQEYCYKTGTGEDVRDFARILRNKVNSKTRKDGGNQIKRNKRAAKMDKIF